MRFRYAIIGALGLIPVLNLSTPVQAGVFETYLGEDVGSSSLNSFYIPSSFSSKGYGSPKKGKYVISGDNAETSYFLRLSNFGNSLEINDVVASYAVPSMPKASKATVSFSYRFVDIDGEYTSSTDVLSVDFRGAQASKKYSDLTVSNPDLPGWNVVSFDLNIDNEVTANRLDIYFSVLGISRSSLPTTYLDVTDISVISNQTEYSKDKDLSSFESSAFKLVSTVSLGEDSRAPYASSVLSSFEHHQNTALGDEILLGGEFEFEDEYFMMDRAGGPDNPLYRGATSVGNGESDTYVIKRGNETFLRMANYNGTTNERTSLVSYYFDNDTQACVNPRFDNFALFSFDYRLYMNEEQKAVYLKDNLPVFEFSSRRANYGNSGKLFLNDVIINEPGDLTYHHAELKPYIASTSTTAYFFFYFYYRTAAKINPDVYCDIDNMACKKVVDGKNYVKFNGTFDVNGFQKLDNLKKNASNPFMPNLAHMEKYGAKPTFERTAQNGPCVNLCENACLTFITKERMMPGAFAYEVEYEGKIEDAEMFFESSFGNAYRLGASSQYSTAKNEDGKAIGYLVSGSPFSYVHLKNTGSQLLKIKSISLKKVESLNTVPGDYVSFASSIGTIFSQIDVSKMSREDEKVTLSCLREEALLFNEFSSQSRMDEFNNRLASFAASISYESNLTALKAIVEEGAIVYSSLCDSGNLPYYRVTLGSLLAEANTMTVKTPQSDVDAMVVKIESLLEIIEGELE